MPLVPGDVETFESVYEETRRSVVGLLIGEEAAGAGFIIHISPKITVVAVPSLCTRDLGSKSITVIFSDGATRHSNDVVLLNYGGLDLLFVEFSGGSRTQVRFGQLGEEESETVLTIVPVVCYNKHQQRTFISQIISPRCTCVNIGGSKIQETKALFSFSLPVGNMDGRSDNPEKMFGVILGLWTLWSIASLWTMLEIVVYLMTRSFRNNVQHTTALTRSVQTTGAIAGF